MAGRVVQRLVRLAVCIIGPAGRKVGTPKAPVGWRQIQPSAVVRGGAYGANGLWAPLSSSYRRQRIPRTGIEANAAVPLVKESNRNLINAKGSPAPIFES